MTKHAWGSADLSDDLEYYDPDPHRHDVPDEICQCGHAEDQHTHTGGGCERLGCTCRWWAAADLADDWQEGWDETDRYQAPV